jgi:FkbM family methyltransferase
MKPPLCYAQNLEDVMLHRIFSDVSAGIYVDIGAWHPTIDSVTRMFYDKGWSGINVDASKKYFRLLSKHRPKDTNLHLAISDHQGKLTFHEIKGSGLSSVDASVKDLGQSLGFRANSYTIECMSLTQLFEKYLLDKEVHFLKIDVEGHEAQVVRSMDWQRFRPIVVVVEAVAAKDQQPAWDGWEPVLLKAKYDFVWFDGLNRFYLRQENQNLKKHFSVPLNLFDGFKLAPHHGWQVTRKSLLREQLRDLLPHTLFVAISKSYRWLRNVMQQKSGM